MLARNTSVTIFDAQPLLREGVSCVIRHSFDFAIVGYGGSRNEMLERVRDLRPDIAIIDPDLPGLNMEALEQARFSSPATRFIALAASRCVPTAVRVLKGPVRGYVLKDRPTDDLVSAIRTVLDGGLYVTPTFAADVIAALNGTRDKSRGSTIRLSRREEQIVQLLLEGRQNRDIARQLGLSERTIKGYMTNLMSKLGVRSRLEVVVSMQQTGQQHQSLQYA